MLPTTEFGPSWEVMQFLVEEEGVPIAATLSSGPAGPAPSCPFAATPRSIFAFTSASSPQPPLHPFTTSFDVLLPPRESCTGPFLRSPQGLMPGSRRSLASTVPLPGIWTHIYTHIHMYIYMCGLWANEWLQEEGAGSDEAASSWWDQQPR